MHLDQEVKEVEQLACQLLQAIADSGHAIDQKQRWLSDARTALARLLTDVQRPIDQARPDDRISRLTPLSDWERRDRPGLTGDADWWRK